MLNYGHHITHVLHSATVPTALGFVLFQQLWETMNTFLLGFLQHTCSATVYPHIVGQAFLVRLQIGRALDIKVVEIGHRSIPNTLSSHGLLQGVHRNEDFLALCFPFEDYLSVKCPTMCRAATATHNTLKQAICCYKTTSGKREVNIFKAQL